MNIKLLNNDVAFVQIESPFELNRLIKLQSNPDDVVIFGKIVAVSDKVKDVCVGDTVILPWTRSTPPILAPIDGVEMKVGITNVKEILGVIEE